MFAYLRWSNDGEPLLVVANMTPVPRLAYRVGAPVSGAWTELLNSDAETYAGSNMGNGGEVNTEDEPAHGMEASLKLNLPPLAVLILKPKKD